MNELQGWYIVKQETGTCAIVPAAAVATAIAQSDLASEQHWGPYASREDAIARRVGLIRAGKCQPVPAAP